MRGSYSAAERYREGALLDWYENDRALQKCAGSEWGNHPLRAEPPHQGQAGRVNVAAKRTRFVQRYGNEEDQPCCCVNDAPPVQSDFHCPLHAFPIQ